MDYFPWEHDLSDQSLAWLHEQIPDEFGDDFYKWRTGEPLASWFPKDVTFNLSKDHGVKLADSLPNTIGCLVVSEKLRLLLASSGATVEFFPVKIRNHKRKVIPEKYHLANVVGLIACTDKSRSDFDLSHIDGRVRRFRRLVLDDSKVPEGTRLFRLAELRELHLVSYDLGIKIKREEKCTGLQLTYIQDYGKEWRGP